jgi:hypothetical protein
MWGQPPRLSLPGTCANRVVLREADSYPPHPKNRCLTLPIALP